MHHHGWWGFRLDLDSVDWAEVEGMVVESYVLAAPRRLGSAIRTFSLQATWKSA
jgi:hypothetical protein